MGAERVGAVLALLLLIACAAAVCVALATQYWFEARVLRRQSLSEDASANVTYSVVGTVHSGLFYGERSIDFGLGERRTHVDVYASVTDAPQHAFYFTRTAWSVVVASACLSVPLTVIAALLAMVNTLVVKPDTLWLDARALHSATIATACTTSLAILFYLIDFYSTVQRSALPRELELDGFTSKNEAKLGYSFYVLIGGAGCSAVALVVLLVFYVVLPRAAADWRHSGEKRAQRAIERRIQDGAVLIY